MSRGGGGAPGNDGSAYVDVLRSLINRHDAFGAQTSDGHQTARRKRLTEDHLRSHLRAEVRIGAYALARDDTCKWGLVDTDRDGVVPVLAVCDVLKRLTLPFAVERSKRRGYHVWVLAAQPVPARQMRALLLAVVQAAGWASLECFPKQEALEASRPLGNFVWLPWFGVSAWPETDATRFLDLERSWHPFPDQVEFLRAFPRVTTQDLQRALLDLGVADTGATERRAEDRRGVPPRWLRVVETNSRARAAWLGQGNHPDRSGSGRDMFLAHEARRCGLSPKETRAVLLAAPFEVSGGRSGDYLDRTIRRAFEAPRRPAHRAYGSFPQEWIDSGMFAALPAPAKALLVVLAVRRMRPSGVVRRSAAGLARDAGISAKGVGRAAARLEELRLIQRQRVAGGRMLYRVLLPPLPRGVRDAELGAQSMAAAGPTPTLSHISRPEHAAPRPQLHREPMSEDLALATLPGGVSAAGSFTSS